MLFCLGTCIYNSCDLEVQGLDICLFYAQFSEAVFIV